jgi:hypothetical protein
MKNKHTLANKKKVNKNLPGIGGETIQVELNQNWSGYNEDGTRHIVDSKVYTKWWQKLLNWITFGLYKPTIFWYKIKPIEK